MNRFTSILAALAGVVGFLLGLVAVRSEPSSRARPGVWAETAATQPLAPEMTKGVATGGVPGPDFAAVAARVNAAVVNVDSAVRGDPSSQRSAFPLHERRSIGAA